MQEHTADDFEPHVGSVFTLADPPLPLTLAALHRHPRPDGHPREPFTLEFRHADGPVQGQGMGTLSHPVVGSLEVFLVSRAPVDGHGIYEADFT